MPERPRPMYSINGYLFLDFASLGPKDPWMLRQLDAPSLGLYVPCVPWTNCPMTDVSRPRLQWTPEPRRMLDDCRDIMFGSVHLFLSRRVIFKVGSIVYHN